MNQREIFTGVQSLLLCHSSNDGTEFGGSVYQKVNSNLETAVTLAWTAGSNNTRFGVGAKYQLDKNSSLSVSADLISQLNKKTRIFSFNVNFVRTLMISIELAVSCSAKVLKV